MADIFSKEKRSAIMRRVSGKNTKPEIMVRQFLYKNGFRYRKNYKKIAGNPDLYILKYNIAIFIHGCFWHGHPGCKHAALPRSNNNYWTNKIQANIKRDSKNFQILAKNNISSITIWECEINTAAKREERLNRLIADIHLLNLQAPG
ncbi:very short patch repair endonuclease [Mucilaginibacter gotjawali]|uniref:Very short patch repair endonuclease n=2 Tax=Mucilaginibacter gotjawali TaxID=1550579 RepID=A0A0X8X4I0_9SPHI|nr:DNA mismatch endonuclease (patch repair protein) [Mucilaginibacter gotjawali]BAU55506.1 Very short patch repair protein [Mucilaginibacter gotjawali]